MLNMSITATDNI